MKQVDKMPTSGQFVAVWEFNDRVWSCTYKWDDDGRLSQYYEDLESGGDGWVGVEIKKSRHQPRARDCARSNLLRHVISEAARVAAFY